MSGIQGQFLEVTVIGCDKLKDTEWISKKDPYVQLEYGNTKFRTKTCNDGGKNPSFQEKFIFTLTEGISEIIVEVWNDNTLTYDDFIGNGKINLLNVLSQGYHDGAWPLQCKTGRFAGEVRLILHYANAIPSPRAQLAPLYVSREIPMFSAPTAASPSSYAPTGSAVYPPPATAYPPSPTPYPSYPAYSPYPPQPVTYPPPPSAYPPPPNPHLYPPSSPYYPPGCYPSSPYPPPSY